MKKHNAFNLLTATILIASVVFTGCTGEVAAPELKVLIVHSYHEGWDWNQEVQAGTVEGLWRQGYTESEEYELQTFYMDTKVTYTTLEQIQERASLAIDLIDEFDPDIVFVNDDNALKYVAVPYVVAHPQSKLPFVFTGVNVDPSIYGPIESLDSPGGTITGALERFPYYEAFSLAKTISPNASTILLLADSSPSSTFVVDAFQQRYLDVVTDSPLNVTGPIQLETFEAWKDTVIEYQAKVDFLGIMTYHQLRDDSGDVIPARQVVDWTVKSSELPEMGFLTFHASDGFLAAAGVDGYKTGIYGGVLGGEILGGIDPGSIAIIDPGAVETAFNLERAEMLGIEIPATELAAADEVFHTIPAD